LLSRELAFLGNSLLRSYHYLQDYQPQITPAPVQYNCPQGPLQVVPEAYSVQVRHWTHHFIIFLIIIIFLYQVHTTPVLMRQVRQVCWDPEEDYFEDNYFEKV
jgi:hypothetical protein